MHLWNYLMLSIGYRRGAGNWLSLKPIFTNLNIYEVTLSFRLRQALVTLATGHRFDMMT